jgi:hypothetical protein
MTILIVQCSPFRVADDRVSTPEINQHRCGNLACIGALLMLTDILGTPGNVSVRQYRLRLPKIRIRYSHSNARFVQLYGPRDDRVQQILILGYAAMHFPVARNQL